MHPDKITLSVGDLIIDHINGLIGFLIGTTDYSEEDHRKLKCWRVFWVGEKIPPAEAHQSWTEIGLINIIEAGSFEHKPWRRKTDERGDL